MSQQFATVDVQVVEPLAVMAVAVAVVPVVVSCSRCYDYSLSRKTLNVGCAKTSNGSILTITL